MTTFELEELDLAYSPPYSSAKDPVNIAGYAASNIIRGDMEIILWEDLAGLDPERHVLIDVRDQREIDELGALPGSLHIPIDDLRDRLAGLDRSKPISSIAPGPNGPIWGIASWFRTVLRFAT
jgi:hypothetical protein